MTASHSQLLPKQKGKAEEAHTNALIGGRVDLLAANTGYLDTHTLTQSAAHQNAILARPFVSENDTHSLVSAPEFAPAFDLLRNQIVGNGHRAKRHAPMTRPGSRGKYYTVHQPITDEQITEHLDGRATYAVPLIGTDGLVSGALIELDTDHLEGARRVQRAAAARNVVIVSIATHGAGGHDGSHNWALFSERVRPAAARYLMQQIAKDAGYPNAETWPNDENIRLPGGRHRWTDDWGVALLPTGELFELGNPDERTAFFAAWQALPLNGTPAEPPKVEQRLVVKTVKTAKFTVLGGTSPIKQFNAAHDVRDLVLSYGGHETRDGLACNCGVQHSHTTQLTVTSQGKLVSYSTNCNWAPHMHSGKAQDAFGLYCLVEHGGDTQKAVEALLPPKKEKISPIGERHTPDPATIEARRKDAQRKRDARKQAAAELRADVEARAAADPDLTPCDHAVLDALLTIAGDRGWARPSKERLAEMSGYSLGSVKRALRNLEGRYFTSEGDGGGPNCTAIRTFLRGSCFESENTSTVKDDPRVVISSSDLDIPVGTCERAADPDTWETWEWAEDCHGAEELNALDQADSVRIAEPNDPPADCEDHTKENLGMLLVSDLSQNSVVNDLQTQPPDRMALVATLEAMTDDELRAWMAELATGANFALEPTAPNGAPEPDTPGASYVGTALIVDDPRAVPSWLRPIGDIGPMERKAEDVEPDVHQETVNLTDLPDPEPEVRCPPADPVLASRYYAIKAKAKKSTSPGQRIALERIAAAMEEWRPASDAPRSQAPPAFRLPPASIVSPMLFGGATP